MRLSFCLGLPDKTRPQEDHASRQLNPTQEPLSRPIQAPANPPKLSEEIVTALYGLANSTNARLPLTPRRRLQAEAGRRGPFPGRLIAVGPIGLGGGETPWIGLPGGGRRCWRWHDQRGEQPLGMATVVGIGRGHDHPQRHGPTITGELHGGTRFTAIHRGGTGLLAPFFAGFLEPSRRT